MKGLKEILISFTIGLATFSTFTYMKTSIKNAERRQNDSQPTQFAGWPEDDSIALNWGLQSIEAPEAWRQSRGSKHIVVAIIDTGCDVHHPDLQENIWRNPGETGLDEYGMSRATNGIDDDDNGFVDDFQGWNFADGSPDVMDDHGHGTHIAGIIGAKKANGWASGVAPDVSLMILKYYDTRSTGSQNLSNTIQAIRYAVRMGAQIINYSGGGILKSHEEEEMLRWAGEQGVLVVAAAGNEGLNSDFFHFYPADYDLQNILSVAAVDRHGQLIPMSNHGLNTVDIAAPGKNIYSTLPNGQYGYMSGTSQATAFATGVAALLMSYDITLNDPKSLIDHLSHHGQRLASLKMKVRSGSILNAAKTLVGSEINLAQRPSGRIPAKNTY